MHAALPLPRALYGDKRPNSRGLDFSNEHTLKQLEGEMNRAAATRVQASSITAVPVQSEAVHDVPNPANHQDSVGNAAFIKADSIADVVAAAKAAEHGWAAIAPAARAAILRRIADLFEAHTAELMSLAVREAGKTLTNAIAEVREAVDFCRYYANEAETTCAGRKPVGTIVAISPWNFPLAIFTGEVVAALAVGNTVIAKPAEQTSLIAYRAVQLMQDTQPSTSVPSRRGRCGRRTHPGQTHQRRRLHRLDRSRPTHQPHPCRARRQPGTHRRNRRPERDDRGQHRACRTSLPGRHQQRLRQRRTTLLRAAHPLPAG